jgi:hypothetical protein
MNSVIALRHRIPAALLELLGVDVNAHRLILRDIGPSCPARSSSKPFVLRDSIYLFLLIRSTWPAWHIVIRALLSYRTSLVVSAEVSAILA